MRSSTEVYLRNRASCGRQPGQQLEAEVVGHEPVVAAEARGGRRARRPGLQRQRRQVQAGGPALRALDQLAQRVRVQLDSRRLQQQPGLRLVQPQVRHADLVQPSMRPPAGHREGRLLAAGDRDLRAGRDVLEQRREHVQTVRALDSVQIVEHEHQWALELGQRAPEARDAG